MSLSLCFLHQQSKDFKAFFEEGLLTELVSFVKCIHVEEAEVCNSSVFLLSEDILTLNTLESKWSLNTESQDSSVQGIENTQWA